MTPPEAPGVDPRQPPAELPEAAPPQPAARLRPLRKRGEFLAAARARRCARPGMVVQARRREDGSDAVGVGFTCSRKIGNAVTRNRAKRRLRAAARAVLPQAARPGWDYVLIGRPGATVERPWEELRRDLAAALGTLHGEGRA